METDYNDYSDAWIELNAQVRLMHNYSLQQQWSMAQQCADRAKMLCETLSEFYEVMT